VQGLQCTSQSSSMCNPMSGATSTLPLVALDLATIWAIGESELPANLARLGLCCVPLCWMECTAMGLERLLSHPSDPYATRIQWISALCHLWSLYWSSLMATFDDRRPLGCRACISGRVVQGSQLVSHSTSKFNAVIGATSALPLVSLHLTLYEPLENWNYQPILLILDCVACSFSGCSGWRRAGNDCPAPPSDPYATIKNISWLSVIFSHSTGAVYWQLSETGGR